MFKDVQSAIIAGGKSSRFGSPKQKALLMQEALLRYAYKLATSISSDVMLIGESATVDKVPINSIPDIIRGCGPVGGIYTALVNASKPLVAVMPVDMPLLPVDVYRFLFPACSQGVPVVARSHKGLEPLVSIWPARIHFSFKQAIENHDYKLYHLIEKERARIIDLTHIVPGYRDDWFTNINYKHELITLEKKYKSLYISP